jgi:uncharacterized protein (DUF433 family)
MTPNDRIQIDPQICRGKPVIRDTRVPVSVVIGSLAAGMDLAEIEAEYGVTAKDVQAALNFANDLIAQEPFHNLPRVA